MPHFVQLAAEAFLLLTLALDAALRACAAWKSAVFLVAIPGETRYRVYLVLRFRRLLVILRNLCFDLAILIVCTGIWLRNWRDPGTPQGAYGPESDSSLADILLPRQRFILI